MHIFVGFVNAGEWSGFGEQDWDEESGRSIGGLRVLVEESRAWKGKGTS